MATIASDPRRFHRDARVAYEKPGPRVQAGFPAIAVNDFVTAGRTAFRRRQPTAAWYFSTTSDGTRPRADTEMPCP